MEPVSKKLRRELENYVRTEFESDLPKHELYAESFADDILDIICDTLDLTDQDVLALAMGLLLIPDDSIKLEVQNTAKKLYMLRRATKGL